MPLHMLSFCVGFLANCKISWFKNLLIKAFIKKFSIILSEAFVEVPEEYSSFNDFFIRALKPTSRPIFNEPNAIVSPVDGTISQIGYICNNSLLQAKGYSYTINALLGQNMSEIFQNGAYITIYLSPKDYHRVHMPILGILEQMTYIPGKLFSVNRKTVLTLPNLFTRNERVITLFQTKLGKMAVVLIGAMFVGSIETTWAGTVNPYHSKEIHRIHYSTKQAIDKICFNHGEEIGRFKMGSTVIVLFEDKNVGWLDNCLAENYIKMGESIGILAV